MLDSLWYMLVHCPLELFRVASGPLDMFFVLFSGHEGWGGSLQADLVQNIAALEIRTLLEYMIQFIHTEFLGS